MLLKTLLGCCRHVAPKVMGHLDGYTHWVRMRLQLGSAVTLGAAGATARTAPPKRCNATQLPTYAVAQLLRGAPSGLRFITRLAYLHSQPTGLHTSPSWPSVPASPLTLLQLLLLAPPRLKQRRQPHLPLARNPSTAACLRRARPSAVRLAGPPAPAPPTATRTTTTSR